MLKIVKGDCLDILPTLEANSIRCCVTSPPYWGLRDYGTAQWKDGDPVCQHIASEKPPVIGSSSTLGYPINGGPRRITEANQYHNAYKTQYRDMCGKCGARRIDSQLGLESTPEEYITKMVTVFRHVWRVLRDDGTLWVNMGDSYAGSSMSGGSRESSTLVGTHHEDRNGCRFNGAKRELCGLKPKDLCGIPWRLAFALQADGWYLRSDIIWHKPNPMPESVTDRPTKAHEYIFLLTKAERYFYDAEAIREPLQQSTIERGYSYSDPEYVGPKMQDSLQGEVRANGTWHGKRCIPAARNKRTVWTIATQPYAEAHFATFPEEIPKLCILAGSKPGDIILDPFAGSGTVGKVALELGRKAILIELNREYIRLIEERTYVTPGFF